MSRNEAEEAISIVSFTSSSLEYFGDHLAKRSFLITSKPLAMYIYIYDHQYSPRPKRVENEVSSVFHPLDILTS
jgi:hypothetical protein